MSPKSWLFIILALFASANTANAAPVTDKDVQAIANSLKYVHGLNQQKDALVIGAVYDPSIADSHQDSERFIAALATLPVSINGFTLKGQLLTVQELATRKDISVIYVASGLTASYPAISTIATKQHLFTVCRDQQCVLAGSCILAVETVGAVNIYLNEQTMHSNGFDVDAAFKFMVKSV